MSSKLSESMCSLQMIEELKSIIRSKDEQIRSLTVDRDREVKELRDELGKMRGLYERIICEEGRTSGSEQLTSLTNGEKVFEKVSDDRIVEVERKVNENGDG